MAITDQINTANSQTCTFGHDDLSRIASVSRGATWSQTFSLDPFGNLSKSGTSSFLPTYNLATNRFQTVPGGTPAYDANGNLTNDLSHTYSWDAEGKALTIDGSTVGLTYDALGRMVEQARGAAYTEIVYGPGGGKLALMSGQTLSKAFVPLPGGATAVYTASGLAYYRHADWLGSARLASTPSRGVYYDGAYAPYGETYAESGTTDRSFTGQNQDTVSGLYDFMFRQYHAVQGRWISPDPAGTGAVNPASPQSWNRYAYVGSSPLEYTDPLGLLGFHVWNVSDDPAAAAFGWVGGGDASVASGAPGSGGCVLNGVQTPCNLVNGVIAAGAGGQCPNNYCPPGLTLQTNGEFYQNVYTPGLVLNCNGASLDNYDCYWSNWSKQFVQNADDIWIVSGDVTTPGIEALFHGPGMKQLWGSASRTVNRAAAATLAIPVVVVASPYVVPAATTVYWGPMYAIGALEAVGIPATAIATWTLSDGNLTNTIRTYTWTRGYVPWLP